MVIYWLIQAFIRPLEELYSQEVLAPFAPLLAILAGAFWCQLIGMDPGRDGRGAI
jgi:hypothetical protein